MGGEIVEELERREMVAESRDDREVRVPVAERGEAATARAGGVEGG